MFSGILRRVVWYKPTDISELFTVIVRVILLIMEAARNYETSVSIYHTKRRRHYSRQSSSSLNMASISMSFRMKQKQATFPS